MSYQRPKNYGLGLLLIAVLMMSSCTAYKQNRMFVVDEDSYESLNPLVELTKEAYTIQPHDQLEVTVYTNKGEQLIDPIRELQIDQPVTAVDKPFYTIDETGEVDLPILGPVKLAGYTLAEAEQILGEKYQVYYKSPFVKTAYLNKRVVVLGATETVVPLPYEGMNLLEVLALAGGLNEAGKSSNIRLIRGDLTNPQVAIIDLSTLEGMQKANLQLQPDDIIYIEPAKRPFAALRDFSPVLVAFTSVLALIIALTR